MVKLYKKRERSLFHLDSSFLSNLQILPTLLNPTQLQSPPCSLSCHLLLIWLCSAPIYTSGLVPIICTLGFPGGTSGKEPVCQCRRHKKLGFDPWVGKTSCSRKQKTALVFLPGESHGQRSLVGHSPQDRKKSGLTQWLSTMTHLCSGAVLDFLSASGETGPSVRLKN